MSKSRGRVVLAYSGGLDTSVAIGWIGEQTGAEVVTVSVDVGQGGEDLETIRQRALDCGAVEAYVADARDEFADEYCMLDLQANGLYMGAYPLISALSRPVIVKHLVTAARRFGATVVAHGCTGKGNDQVRFENGITSLAPDLTCISPVRDLAMTREFSIDYANRHDLPIETTHHNPFSIDQNVWGRAIETGFLEDIWNGPTKDVYTYTDDPTYPPLPDEVVVAFESGVPVAVDGQSVTPLQAIQELNRRAGAQGIGRIDIVEDRLVGIKSREIYEAPGARDDGPRSDPLQADRVRPVEHARVRGAVVLPAQALPGRLHPRHPGVRLRRHQDGSARGAGDRDRAAVAQLALRLQSGHVRRRRHVRPVQGARIHRDLRHDIQAGGGPRRRIRPRRGHGQDRSLLTAGRPPPRTAAGRALRAQPFEAPARTRSVCSVRVRRRRAFRGFGTRSAWPAPTIGWRASR